MDLRTGKLLILTINFSIASVDKSKIAELDGVLEGVLFRLDEFGEDY